jgi:hypothetical protein
MSQTTTLSSVTLQTLENYRHAASRAVVAYRLGGKRLIDALNGALENRVYPRTAKIAPRATKRLNQVRGSVSEVIVKGVDQVAQRTEQAIEFGSASATAQVSKLAGFAARIRNPRLASGVQRIARFGLPGAKVALAMSNKIAQGANALADSAGARPMRSLARKAATQAKRRATPMVRSAKTTLKAGAKRAANLGKRAPA